MVDYSPRAVDERLRLMAEAARISTRSPHAIDLSSAAVTLRLETLGALSALCWSLRRR